MKEQGILKKLIFKAAYGDEDRMVEISDVTGTGGSYFLMIGNFYKGSFHNELGEKWVLSVQIPNRSLEKALAMETLSPSLQTEDIRILEEIFKSNFLENC